MKHIIEFTLPEDRELLELHMKAGTLAAFVDEWEIFMRSESKHGSGEAVSWEAVRSAYFNLKLERQDA